MAGLCSRRNPLIGCGLYRANMKKIDKYTIISIKLSGRRNFVFMSGQVLGLRQQAQYGL